MSNKYYIFTFGAGQEHEGRYVKIMLKQNETAEDARIKMCHKYGTTWGFMYSQEEWERLKNDPNRTFPLETLLETIV